jgi:type IV fimbrial biogenesis protein FimT
MRIKLHFTVTKSKCFAIASKGFTLIELLVTIATLVVLISIAMPDLRSFIISSKLSSNVNEFVGILNYARSEAIARNKVVIVCSKAANGDCSNDQSWGTREVQVFVDENNDGNKDATDPVIKTLAQQDINATQFNFKRENVGNSPPLSVSFLPAGYVKKQGRFTIEAVGDAAYSIKYGRMICISSAGRVRVSPNAGSSCPT